LAEYVALAQMEALQERESQIFELRYGFMGGDIHTLEQIGQEFGISRERVRQIIQKCYNKIRSKGRRQIKNGKTNEACAELILYIEILVKLNADENEVINRLIDLASSSLSYLPAAYGISLIAYFAYPNQYVAKLYIDKAVKRLREYKAVLSKINQEKRQAEKLQSLLAYIIWPKEVKLFTEEEIAGLECQRKVSLKGEGNAGSFYSSKLNRLIEYESELELEFLLLLEQSDEVMFYQEQPLKVFYEHQGETKIYYPDILLILKDGRSIVVEIKPVFKMALQENLIKWSALRKFCAKKGLGLLVTDGRYSIQQVQHYHINSEFGNAIFAALQSGPLSWRQYKEIRDIYNPSRNEFIALVLKNKLVWKLIPFTLDFSPYNRLHSVMMPSNWGNSNTR